MKKSRYSEEQIIGKLKQHEAEVKTGTFTGCRVAAKHTSFWRGVEA